MESNGESAPEVLIEADVPLSASVLWRLQRVFYDRAGAEAWSTGTVPFLITSNAFIARAYAAVILGFLRDCAAAAGAPPGRLDPVRPVHIIELGAGSGRLAFLLLRQLRALVRALVPAGDEGAQPVFRYVMTDFTEANLRVWAAHPALQPFVAEGLLDFARFDAEQDRELTLLQSGTVLGPGSLAGPVVVIANYVFDSLAHDAWRIDGGELRQGRGTLVARQTDEPDLDDPTLIERLALHMDYVPADDPPYGDPALDRILAGYRARLGDTSVLLPVGALGCLRALADLLAADGGNPAARLLLLSADKGYTREDELLDRPDPALTLHGSFSLSVNYHAIGAYVRDRGGLVLDAPAWDGSLPVAAFVLGAGGEVAAESCRATSHAFGEAVAGFGPYHFHVLLAELQETSPTPSLKQILALLRLSAWDPVMATRYHAVLLEQARDAPGRVQRELVDALERTWANYFSIGTPSEATDDLPFQIGTILQAVRRPAEAIEWYRRSLELFGEHHATYTNMGVCLHLLSRPAEAIAALDRALVFQPGYGAARDWRIRVQSELAGRQGADEAAVPLGRDEPPPGAGAA